MDRTLDLLFIRGDFCLTGKKRVVVRPDETGIVVSLLRRQFYKRTITNGVYDHKRCCSSNIGELCSRNS